MPSFEYWVKDKTGKDLKGVQDAQDAQELVRQLKAQEYMIIRVEQAQKKSSMLSIQKGSAPKMRKGKSGGIKLDDLVIFSRQMATLVAAGIPLIQALDILASQVDKEKFRLVLRRMHADLQSGKSLSEAMQSHPKVFSGLFIHMVRAGEMSGKLQEILDRVAHYFEKSSALQKKVKAALMYPMAVSTMAFAITFFMLAFVIPQFATIFDGLGAKLPVPTQILIAVSNYLAANWWWILALLGGSIFLFVKFIRSPMGRLPWDSFTLRMPIFGTIILKVAVSKFARTLSTLVRSGVAILAALEIVSKTSGNTRI
jgi:type IV pilus assembly protein PilC